MATITLYKYLEYNGVAELIGQIKTRYAPIQALQYKGTVANIEALPVVTAQKIGSMYGIREGGLTTADFVEGADKFLRDGSNVVVVNIGTESSPILKWDILAGILNIADRLQFGNSFPPSPNNGDIYLWMGDTTYTYDEVTPIGTESPRELGWYVYNTITELYELSIDTTIISGRTYYVKNIQYEKGVIYKYNILQNKWLIEPFDNLYINESTATIESLFV